MKPKVAILTSLTDFAPAYSLCGIILDQARALQRERYPYDLLVHQSFNQADRESVEKEGLSVKFVLPQTRLHKYGTSEPPRPTTNKEVGFEDQVEIHLKGQEERGSIGFEELLAPYDTVITHDLMFLEDFLVQNAAIRQCIDKWPEKNWLHWIHSGPSQAPPSVCYPSTLRYSAAPNSTYVFLNNGKRLDCALMLKTQRDTIAVVTNPKDIRDVYEFHHDTCVFIEKYDLFNHDMMQVYAFSTPRWESKGVKHLLTLAGHWKRAGVRVKLVLVNAHCNSAKDVHYLEQMEKYAVGCGLDLDVDVIFTHRFSSDMEAGQYDLDEVQKWRQWRHCVPDYIVRELYLMSNLFVFPSATECCSLIQAESSITNKFMVLNSDFEPMLEFCSPSALRYEFTINNPDDAVVRERGYYECVAREIWAEFQTESALMNGTIARNVTYNRDHIFKTQLEPLLWKKFSGKATRVADDKVAEVEAPFKKTKTWTEKPISMDERVRAIDVEPIKPEKLPDYNDPQPGDECPIYGSCSEERKKLCYEQAGHCLLLDEVLEGAK